MKNWKEADLSKMMHIKHGYAFKGEYFVPEGDYMVLTPGNFYESGGFRIRDGKEKFYSGEIPQSYVLQKNDLIVAMTEQGEGLLGSTALIPESNKYLHNQRLGLVELNPDLLEKKFIYYLFNASWIRQQIRNSSSGTKVRHTSPERIYKVKVKIPPLETQKKIAAVLSGYDDLIENNNRRIALLEKMAEEIYREWFVRFRFPGWQNTQFEKGIPKDWEQTSLSKITKIKMGQSPKSEFYNSHGEGLPFHQGVGSYGDRFPIHETFCTEQKRIAEEGDILFSVRAPVGRLNIANEKIIIGRGLSAIRHQKNYQSYLFYLLKVAFSREDIIGNGSIFNSVGKEELNNFKVLNPPKEIIDSFQTLVVKIDSQISNLFRSNSNLLKTKNSLLPRLISGKLSVEELDIAFPPSMQKTVEK